MIAVVFAGGPVPPTHVAEAVPVGSLVVAADSGLDHARALGVVPDVLVGDLDSISADGLRWARDSGIPIDTHPPDKDATDLALALRHAATRVDEVLVIDGGGGRLDQSFGNLLLLASDEFADLAIRAQVGAAVVTVVRGERRLFGDPGSYVSLFALGGDAGGVTTDGLRWELVDATLTAGSSLGVSNELAAPAATVTVADGVVAAIQPE